MIIVRAGARDGMGWWDDEALTEAGTYALAKIFPRNPSRIAIRLAFRAARARHAGVLSAASVNDATTLLDLVEGEPADLGDATALAGAPIGSPEELRERLVGLEPEVASFSLPPPTAEGLLDMSRFVPGSTVCRATILAAGYLAAGKGHPVFPFLRSTTEGRS
ncbi:MAG: hypothetical protein ACREXX_17485 [Gammaproteobacteria bacterium]